MLDCPRAAASTRRRQPAAAATVITYCGRVRLAVALPQDLSGSGPATLTSYVRRAEQLGFDGLWALDSGIGGPTARVPYLDPLPALAAAVTERIQLGVAVIVASRRNPVQLAKDAASLAVLSADRFVLGLGVGTTRRRPRASASGSTTAAPG